MASVRVLFIGKATKESQYILSRMAERAQDTVKRTEDSGLVSCGQQVKNTILDMEGKQGWFWSAVSDAEQANSIEMQMETSKNFPADCVLSVLQQEFRGNAYAVYPLKVESPDFDMTIVASNRFACGLK